MVRLDGPAGADAEGADVVAGGAAASGASGCFLSSHATHARSIMESATVRMSVRLACLSACMCLLPAQASAEEPPVKATMQCERAIEPGRVRCSVEVKVVEG